MSVKFNQIKVYQHVWINQHFRLNFRSYAKRYKAKEKRDKNIVSALAYCDSTYPPIFGETWHNVRLGLLCATKYAAIVNNASPAYAENNLKLQALGTLDVGEVYKQKCAAMRTQLGEDTAGRSRQEKNNEGKPPSPENEHKPRHMMTDDEIAQLEAAPPAPRYPQHFRQVPGAGVAVPSRPSSDRLILPHAHLTAEAQADLLQDFMPSTSLKGLFDLEEETDVFVKHRVTTKPGEGPGINIEMAKDFLKWPGLLTVRAFYRGDISRLPQPSSDYGLSDHFALNGSSLFPVLLLGLSPGDAVLDACAAPGGKTLAILQTGLPGMLQSSDLSSSRTFRIGSVVSQFYSNNSPLIAHHHIAQADGRTVYGNGGEFDKVLVDVPCNNDRHSVTTNDNNILANKRKKERLQLPETQTDLLTAALQNVKVGGAVVYCTCTLSPVQNDGVVHLALNRLWDSTKIECKVIDYSNVLSPFNFMYKFAKGVGLKYGQLILPTLTNNYGPMYCAKIVRMR